MGLSKLLIGLAHIGVTQRLSAPVHRIPSAPSKHIGIFHERQYLLLIAGPHRNLTRWGIGPTRNLKPDASIWLLVNIVRTSIANERGTNTGAAWEKRGTL